MNSHKLYVKGGRHWVDRIEHSSEETVTWTCDDSEFMIWFPPDHDPLAPGDNKSNKGTLTRKLRPNLAKKEEYEYSMYCFKDHRLVESSSPPTMIIK